MDLSNVNNIQKIMAIGMGIASCLQRLSIAIGSICWGVAIACFLYLLFAAYKMGTLKAKIEAYKPYYKVILLMWLCFLPTVIFAPDLKTSIKNDQPYLTKQERKKRRRKVEVVKEKSDEARRVEIVNWLEKKEATDTSIVDLYDSHVRRERAKRNKLKNGQTKK